MILKAEIITQDESDDNTDVEINIEEFELAEIELEKNILKNMRNDLAMLMKIIDKDTITDYSRPPRKKFEVRGGYKIAINRKVPLTQVQVYNLYFRFKKGAINCSDCSALMYRPENSHYEWIFLLPDDTNSKIAIEKEAFIEESRKYVFSERMKSEAQNELLENLNMLNVNERCAQSLIHEFGHVLHWRIFDRFEVDKNIYELYANIYLWCYESGYIENLDKRIPNFKTLDDLKKLDYIKESLVEDYRIGVNLQCTNGKYILPNSVTYKGDFVNHSLLEEGVQMVKKMLSSATSLRRSNKSIKAIQSGHRDPVDWIKELNELENAGTWMPGQLTMTSEDHLEVVRRLKLRAENHEFNENSENYPSAPNVIEDANKEKFFIELNNEPASLMIAYETIVNEETHTYSPNIKIGFRNEMDGRFIRIKLLCDEMEGVTSRYTKHYKVARATFPVLGQSIINDSWNLVLSRDVIQPVAEMILSLDEKEETKKISNY